MHSHRCICRFIIKTDTCQENADVAQCTPEPAMRTLACSLQPMQRMVGRQCVGQLKNCNTHQNHPQPSSSRHVMSCIDLYRPNCRTMYLWSCMNHAYMHMHMHMHLYPWTRANSWHHSWSLPTQVVREQPIMYTCEEGPLVDEVYDVHHQLGLRALVDGRDASLSFSLNLLAYAAADEDAQQQVGRHNTAQHNTTQHKYITQHSSAQFHREGAGEIVPVASTWGGLDWEVACASHVRAPDTCYAVLTRAWVLCRCSQRRGYNRMVGG